MNIDLKKNFDKKNKQYEYDSRKDNINNFYNQKDYKVKLINIDSAFRNKIPKNIYKSSNSNLSLNPITTTSGSNILQIYYPNHTFNIGDNIIIQNVEGPYKTLSNSLFFFINYQYLFINFNNHNIPLNYLNYVDNYKVLLELVSHNILLTAYGNMPINAILNISEIYLPSIINNNYPFPNEVFSLFNVTNASQLDNNYFLIKLPYSFTIQSGLYYSPNDVFKITLLSIGGIPLNYINADYPINYQRNQGMQQIINTDLSNIYIESSIVASGSVQGGGNKIQIMLITNTLPGYPDANNYTILLNQSFNNIVRIELLSTEIPYIDFLIKSSGSNQNNKLYWKHFDDGNYLYELSIPEGNYNSTSLISKITEIINLVPRLNSTLEQPIYNIFNINLNSYTQEITFSPFKYNNLPNSLSVNIVEINNIKYVNLTVYHPGNLVEKLDTIIISGAVKIGTIIDATYINATQTVYDINITDQTYSVLLGPLNQITNQTTIDLTGNGGPGVVVKTRAKVSFIFTFNNTLGNVLGFKNVGDANAITPYSTIISNLNSYILYTNLNQVGNINTSPQLLNFAGNNMYILMYLNNYENIINNSNQPIAFAKILLTGNPGDVLFNTFINYPLEFDFPISTLNELIIYFTYPDGTLVDFRNIDHSFTLKITEQINTPYNTGLNSKNISLIDSIIDTHENDK